MVISLSSSKLLTGGCNPTRMSGVSTRRNANIGIGQNKNMKRGLALAALGFVGIAGLAIAADVDLSKLPPASSKKDLTYEKDIQPILKASCFNCHGPTGRAREA